MTKKTIISIVSSLFAVSSTSLFASVTGPKAFFETDFPPAEKFNRGFFERTIAKGLMNLEAENHLMDPLRRNFTILEVDYFAVNAEMLSKVDYKNNGLRIHVYEENEKSQGICSYINGEKEIKIINNRQNIAHNEKNKTTLKAGNSAEDGKTKEKSLTITGDTILSGGTSAVQAKAGLNVRGEKKRTSQHKQSNNTEATQELENETNVSPNSIYTETVAAKSVSEEMTYDLVYKLSGNVAVWYQILMPRSQKVGVFPVSKVFTHAGSMTSNYSIDESTNTVTIRYPNQIRQRTDTLNEKEFASKPLYQQPSLSECISQYAEAGIQQKKDNALDKAKLLFKQSVVTSIYYNVLSKPQNLEQKSYLHPDARLSLIHLIDIYLEKGEPNKALALWFINRIHKDLSTRQQFLRDVSNDTNMSSSKIDKSLKGYIIFQNISLISGYFGNNSILDLRWKKIKDEINVENIIILNEKDNSSKKMSLKIKTPQLKPIKIILDKMINSPKAILLDGNIISTLDLDNNENRKNHLSYFFAGFNIPYLSLRDNNITLDGVDMILNLLSTRVAQIHALDIRGNKYFTQSNYDALKQKYINFKKIAGTPLIFLITDYEKWENETYSKTKEKPTKEIYNNVKAIIRKVESL